MNPIARILMVEDNPMDVELALHAFREIRLRHEIQVVTTGIEALDALFGHGEFADRVRYPLPDLVLLDLNLPGVDGFDVLRRVKSTPVLKRLPIVILTSSREDGDRALSYDMGANSYLVKPITFGDFVDVVHRIERYWLSLNVGPPEVAG